MFYDAKLSKTTELTISNPDCIPPKLILWKLWILSFKKETTTDTLASQSKLEGNAKSNSVSGEWRVESSNFYYWLGTYIWRGCEKWFGNTHAWERFAWTNICLGYCSHPFTHDLHWHCRVQNYWRNRGAFAPLLSILIQAQICWHNNYWTIHELSGI